MSVYYFSASYYADCGTGNSNNACNSVTGPCYNSAMQCAWANLSGHGNSIAYYCGSSWLCNDKRASDVPLFSCGDVLWVQDLCNNNGVHVTVVDHGPNVCFCESKCNSVNLMRAIDLTEGAFSYLENGSLTKGHIPVMIQT